MGKSSPLGMSGEYYMFCHPQVYPLNDPVFLASVLPRHSSNLHLLVSNLLVSMIPRTLVRKALHLY